jgi:type I restriction enzyme S subunit
MSYSEWEVVKLSTILDFYNGKVRPKMQGNIPVFGGNGIMDYANEYNYSDENIIIGRVGAYCGNVNYYYGKLWISDNAINIKPKESLSYGKYVYYLLINQNLHNRRIGSSQPLITQTILKNIEVRIPPMEEQKAIANILSSLDDKIELNNKINKNLEEMAQALYKQWFVDFEFPNEDGEPYKSSGGDMIESELGLIPKGWEAVNLIDLVDKVNGYSYKGTDLGESKIGMVTIKNSSRDRLFNIDGFKDIMNVDRVKERHFVNKGDVLITCTDVTQNADYIGNSIYLYSLGKYDKLIYSMDLIKLVSKNEKISNHIIYEITRDINFKNFALGYTKGTTVLHLNKNVIDDYKIAVPKNKLLQDFDKLIKDFHFKVGTLMNENIYLMKLRDTLLPKLMSGEIEVPIEG